MDINKEDAFILKDTREHKMYPKINISKEERLTLKNIRINEDILIFCYCICNFKIYSIVYYHFILLYPIGYVFRPFTMSLLSMEIQLNPPL